MCMFRLIFVVAQILLVIFQVECNKDVNQKKPNKEKCELALEEGKSQEHLDQFAMLMDDEELELQESQAGPNPVTCSAHFATNGLHGCSLCKGWFHLLYFKLLMTPLHHIEFLLHP